MVLQRLIIVLLMAGAPLAFANETVILRADYWYPFNGYPNSIKPGFMVEIAKRAFAKEGIAVNYQLMSWEGALQNASDGNIDCVLGASKIEGRGLLYPKNSFGMTDTGFYARYGEIKHFSYKGLASLRNYRIGMVGAAVHIEDPALLGYIDKYQSTDKVFLSRADKPLRDLMAKLLANQIDLIIETPRVFHAVAQEQRLSVLFEEVALMGNPQPVYIACSKANPKSAYYLQLLDKQLVEMRENGALETLLNSYGLTDWQ